MKVEITEESPSRLAEYASVPIAFEIRTVFDLGDGVPTDDPSLWTERAVDSPMIKDYDAIPGENPISWPVQFGMTNWGLFGAHVDGSRVGSAAIVYDTPGIDLLEGRRDLAILWDIRIDPAARRHGAGTALFHAAEEWARSRGCCEVMAETQNTNVAACKFYLRCGCVLRGMNRRAYPRFPNEVQVLFHKRIFAHFGG